MSDDILIRHHASGPGEPVVTGLFDVATNAVGYILACPATKRAALVDTVLDFDLASGEMSTRYLDRMLEEVAAQNLTVEWVLESHVHADHLSAMPLAAARTGAKMGIGARIDEVQRVFGKVFNAGTAFQMDGSQFDRLWDDGDRFTIGDLKVEVMHTPGHTPACVTYVVRGSDGPAAAFVGDTLFMPDYGTARCDFPGGDAGQLYASIQRVLDLPGDTRLFLCHDYKAPGRDDFAWETSVDEEAARNVHVGAGKTEAEFVAFRQARDATLSAPKLMMPAIQVNMRAGHLPPPEDDGQTYLKIPVRPPS